MNSSICLIFIPTLGQELLIDMVGITGRLSSQKCLLAYRFFLRQSRWLCCKPRPYVLKEKAPTIYVSSVVVVFTMLKMALTIVRRRLSPFVCIVWFCSSDSSKAHHWTERKVIRFPCFLSIATLSFRVYHNFIVHIRHDVLLSSILAAYIFLFRAFLLSLV